MFSIYNFSVLIYEDDLEMAEKLGKIISDYLLSQKSSVFSMAVQIWSEEVPHVITRLMSEDYLRLEIIPVFILKNFL